MVIADKVVVSLEAKMASWKAEVNNASRIYDQNMDKIAKSSLKAEAAALRSSTAIKGAFAGLGAIFAASELIKYADTWVDLSSRVNIAAGSIEKGTEVMGRLGEMARRTYSDLEQTAESYLASSTALQELGYTTDQSLDYTEALNNALVVSGAKADRAARVIDALSKAMALGKLQGDNLNTVISTGGRAAEALAAGLNTTVGGLRKLGAEGKITGRVMVDALSSQMETLRREAESMPATIGDGFTLLRNAILQYVGDADSVTGVSEKFSEALIIIADNFDKVADAGLQVAAVFAGALLGRSIANMIKTLGLGAKALKDFRAALMAAQNLSGVATAVSGLGAAAGPLGIILGGAVVGSLAMYSSHAAEATMKSEAFEKELVSLGLLAQKSASDIDDAAESIVKLGDAQAAQKIRSIADEIERLRTGGRFGGAGDELNALQSGARGSLWDDKADAAAKKEISELITLLQTTQITAGEVRKRMDAIRTTPVSDSVKELADNLDRTAAKMEALNARVLQLGAMPELDNAKEQLNAVIDDLDRLEKREVITAAQRKNLEDALVKLRDTGEGADDARAALEGLSKLSFSTTLVGLDGLIGRVRVLWQEANKANAVMSGAYALGPDENKRARSSLDPYIQQRKAENETAKAFEQNAMRRAKLTKDQLALENKIAEVRKRLENEGVTSPEKGLVERIAQAELAAEKLRSAEGKKAKAEKKERENDYVRLTKAIADRTATIVAETEVQRQLNPLIDDYGYAVEKARAGQELLNAAQKAGLKITPELRAEISLAAEQFAMAAVEANQLAEAQEEIKRTADEWRDTEKAALRGIVDDLIAGKSAADAFAGALKKIGDKLLDMAFDGLFTGMFKSNGGSFLGGLIPGFANGTNFAPGGVALVGERGPELVNLPRGSQVIPNHAISNPVASGGWGRGSTVVNFSPQIDARGADSEGLVRVQQQLDRMKRELPSTVIQTIRKAQSDNVKLG